MAKQKQCKTGLSLNIGNRKVNLTNPIDLEEDAIDTNHCDNELTHLIYLFEQAIITLPNAAQYESYTKESLKDSLCEYFDLQRVTI